MYSKPTALPPPPSPWAGMEFSFSSRGLALRATWSTATAAPRLQMASEPFADNDQGHRPVSRPSDHVPAGPLLSDRPAGLSLGARLVQTLAAGSGGTRLVDGRRADRLLDHQPGFCRCFPCPGQQ